MSSLRGPWAAVRSAANDRQSGSAQIARAAAEAISALPPADIPKALRTLLVGHPSMGALWRLANEVLSGESPKAGATAFVEQLDRDRAGGKILASLLPPWVLTISYSSSVLDCLRQARLRMVSCMESQPGGEGRRMAEAISAWGPARVVSDQEALRRVPGAAVVVGCDALVPNGVVNKVGTRALTEAALIKAVPCYAIAGMMKFVAGLPPVESSFEVVPLDLFEAIATAEGMLSPSDARARATEATLHPDLRPVLASLGGR